jgi:hypothetical protein
MIRKRGITPKYSLPATVGAEFGTPNGKNVTWPGTKFLRDWMGSVTTETIGMDTDRFLMDKTITDNVTQEANKGKIFAFSDDDPKFLNDIRSAAFSPYKGSITVPYPSVKTYYSPAHYVSAMLATYSGRPLIPGDRTPCMAVLDQLEMLLSLPKANVIMSATKVCENDAIQKGWFRLNYESVNRGFWMYLWLGIWYKFLQHPEFVPYLMSTGNKLLAFEDSDDTFGAGVGGDNTNAAGFILMILRTVIGTKGLGIRANPAEVFNKFVRPIISGEFGRVTGPLKSNAYYTP